jgi:hypothetical protein
MVSWKLNVVCVTKSGKWLLVVSAPVRYIKMRTNLFIWADSMQVMTRWVSEEYDDGV